MTPLKPNEITQYVKENIGTGFHEPRLAKIENIKLKELLERKNPYLYKAKAVLTASRFIELLLQATISSSEEATFGNFLEGVARFVCEKVYGGRKSSTDGLDLEFERDGIRYIVAVKSGPNWGNSQQIARMRSAFVTARKILATSGARVHVECVNGCCYGKTTEKSRYKGDYQKVCGQEFWELISGSSTLYTDIIEPLGHEAVERNEKADIAYSQIINKITKEFLDKYCDPSGVINWEEITRINSGVQPPPPPKIPKTPKPPRKRA